MTRDVDDSTYRAAGAGNPPPLHVRSNMGQGAWFPYARPYVHPAHPGPLMVMIPSLPPDEFGEDPTDPARCHQARIPTGGLVARLDLRSNGRPHPNVGPRGERR